MLSAFEFRFFNSCPLLRKGYEINQDLFYCRNGAEVDFLIQKKGKVMSLIQVCYDLEDFDTKEREVKALLKFSELFKCNNLLVITYDYKNEEKFGRKKIKYVPFYEFSLSTSSVDKKIYGM